jgi:hypothetical protein
VSSVTGTFVASGGAGFSSGNNGESTIDGVTLP